MPGLRLHYLVPVFAAMIGAAFWFREPQVAILDPLMRKVGISLARTEEDTTSFIVNNAEGGIESFADGEDGHEPRRISIPDPDCSGLSFATLPYDELGLDDNARFIDFAAPKELSPLYGWTNKPQCGYEGNPWGYGRHHIYPLSLIARVVAFLKEYPEFYGGNKDDFCPWLAKDLLNEDLPKEKQTLRRIQIYLPHNTQIQPFYMPWLEATASSIKGKLFNNRRIVTQATWEGYSDDMRVHMFRATMGILSYMNDPDFSTAFICSSRRVRQIWILWYNRVKKETGKEPLGKGVLMSDVYNKFVYSVVSNILPSVREATDNMLDWWPGLSSTTPLKVTLDNICRLEPALPPPNPFLLDRTKMDELASWIGKSGFQWASLLLNDESVKCKAVE